MSGALAWARGQLGLLAPPTAGSGLSFLGALPSGPLLFLLDFGALGDFFPQPPHPTARRAADTVLAVSRQGAPQTPPL